MFTRRFTRARVGLIGLLICACFLLQPHLGLLSTPTAQTGSQTGVAHAQAEPPIDDTATKIYLPSIAKDGVPSAVGTATATPEKAFAQQLQALATLFAEWEEAVTADAETAEYRTALAQSKHTLTDLDRQVRTNFTAREAKLRTAALPDLILERHLDSVQRHDAAWQTLLDLLTTLETTTDPNALRTAIGSARDFLLGQQPQPLVQLPRNDDLASRKATVLPAVTFNAEVPAIQAAATQALLSIPPNPPVAADLLPTIDLQLTPAITDLATSLGNSPLELYRYVKNNIAYEPYLGSRKGATATLAMQAGNSYDQASLLIALLRAAGIPARYVTGRAVVPAPQVNSWLGVDDVDAAAALFNMAGLQVQGYLMPIAGDTSDLYLTAQVLLTLQAYNGYAEMGTITTTGAAWLVSQQQADGGWGSPTTVSETALAWRALKQLNVTPTNESGALNYLLNRQQGNGSWNGRAYDTALALLALQDALILPTPSPTSGPTATATNTRPAPPTITPTWTNTPIPVPSATPTLIPTFTPSPTITPTPTRTPTITPTPAPTPIPANATTIYLTSNVNGTVGGVAYADEDLLAFDIATGGWSLFFDGSDVGVDGGANLNAFHLETDGTLLLSFEAALVLPELGTANQQDIVRFTPSSLGATTAGSWSFYFDGSDVGLESADEMVDAIGRHPDGRLLVSVGVNYTIGTLSGEDEDLLLFSATSLGDTTAGSWKLYLDGSDVGLANAESEDIWGLWSDPATGQSLSDDTWRLQRHRCRRRPG